MHRVIDSNQWRCSCLTATIRHNMMTKWYQTQQTDTTIKSQQCIFWPQTDTTWSQRDTTHSKRDERTPKKIKKDGSTRQTLTGRVDVCSHQLSSPSPLAATSSEPMEQHSSWMPRYLVICTVQIYLQAGSRSSPLVDVSWTLMFLHSCRETELNRKEQRKDKFCALQEIKGPICLVSKCLSQLSESLIVSL